MERVVTGRVLNSATGAPVARALVNLNGRAVLTDAEGKFSFPGFTDAVGYVEVSKPGYLGSPSPEFARAQTVSDLTLPLELKLYPDAVLTGVITGPDGLPLSRIQVRLRRLTFDSSGARWLFSGFGQTNTRGEYRISTPAGRYRVTTGYAARSVERGETVLPTIFPANGPESTAALELIGGETRQLDLRPRVAPSFPVRVQVEGGDSERGLRLQATTPGGTSFNLQTTRDEAGLVTQLPLGTFNLRGTEGDRDEPLEGEARIIVTGRGTAQTTIHLSALPVFPVETAVELAPVATGTSTPAIFSAQQLNLTLQNVDTVGESLANDVRLRIRADKTGEFLVPLGRYRLTGGPRGAWYLRAATSGVTDLLTEELVVAAGAAGSPIRLVVSNATGSLKGTVAIAGQPSAGWVYLIPQQPSLMSYFEVFVQTDGSYRWSGPPGKYIAVASAQQVREDFRDAAFLRKFTAGGRAAEIAPGIDATLDLELAQTGVAR